jgi:mRNA interferase MazF
LQSDDFDKTLSVTVVPFTSDPTDAQFARPEIAPSALNGLQAASRLMVDKITTLPRHRLGRQVGELSSEEMNRVDRATILFLGLGG